MHIREGSVRYKDFRAAWNDLLTTNVMLPHKVLCSEILHIIPNRNNLSTATLEQEVTSRCGVESSALVAAQHPLYLIMSRQSCLFPRVCFCSNSAASLVVTPVSVRLRGKWSLRDVFLETPSIRRTAWIVKTLGWISWLFHSFPPSPRASSLTLLSITPNPKQPDAQGPLTRLQNEWSSHEESKSTHRKTWLVDSSPRSPPQLHLNPMRTNKNSLL